MLKKQLPEQKKMSKAQNLFSVRKKHHVLKSRRMRTDNRFAAPPAAMPYQYHAMTQITPELIRALSKNQ